MKKISKFLLIGFSVILAISGYLSSKASDIRVEKEETIYYLLEKTNILNAYYNIGEYGGQKHSLANYQQMIDDQVGSLTKKITDFDPRIRRFSNWATALLIISICGNTLILSIEAIKGTSEKGSG